MPLPIEMLLRMNDSPVPAHTTFGSDGATDNAPIEETGWAKCPYCGAEYTLRR